MGRGETDDGNEGRETAYGAIFATAAFRLPWIVCARRANGGLLYPSPSPPPARGGGILLAHASQSFYIFFSFFHAESSGIAEAAKSFHGSGRFNTAAAPAIVKGGGSRALRNWVQASGRAMEAPSRARGDQGATAVAPRPLRK